MMRIAAFTLLEIVVAMMITGLVAAMAVVILTGRAQVIKRSLKLGDAWDELRRATTSLAADLDRSSEVSVSAEGLVCTVFDGAVTYQQQEAVLVRIRSGGVDTLLHQSGGLQFTTHPADQALLAVGVNMIIDEDTCTCWVRYHPDAVSRTSPL